MSLFDTYVMVDWSGGNDAGPRPKKDAIWACICRAGQAQPPVYLRNRQIAEAWLADLMDAELSASRRLCVGFDFPFGYPRGFAEALTASTDPLAMWDWFAARIEDAPDHNNRCEVASDINAQFGGIGPFWGNPFQNREFAHLPRKGSVRTNTQFPEKRAVERLARGSFTCWQLAGAGAVGSQVLMGLPVLARLRRKFAGQVAVWPFEALDRPVAFVEIWPSLIAKVVDDLKQPDEIKDAAQVRILVESVSRLDATSQLRALLDDGQACDDEGWILGVGHEARLSAAARGAAHV